MMCKVTVVFVRRTAMSLSVPAKMSMVTFGGAISAFGGRSQLVSFTVGSTVLHRDSIYRTTSR